jgi:hypothetical protein
MEQYETLSKFDRAFAGLQGGNNLPTKPATVEYVEPITGDAETFIVQTVRAEYKVSIKKGWDVSTETRTGDFIVVKFVDKDGTKRLILPPRVAETIHRQHEALSKKNRANASKAVMRERIANGFVPAFSRKAEG